MMSPAPTVAYCLEFRDGRPVITENGTAMSPAAYCDCILWNKDEWIARNRDFVDSGVRIYFLGTQHDWTTFSTPYWTGDGEYPDGPTDPDAFDLDAQAQAILAMQPEARFFVRPGEMVPKTWQTKYPDHMQRASNGEPQSQLSLASEMGGKHFAGYLHNVIGYCEARPWADRVIGYMFFPHGEGLTELACNGFAFDQAPVMQTAFRAWIETKYTDERALREAWQDADVTFETVRVPTESEWKLKRQTLKHWPEPAQVQRERDYFALQETLFRQYFRRCMRTLREATAHRRVLLGIDALKQPMFGWMLNLAFGRDDWITDPMTDYPDMFLATGTIDVADLLDDDGWQIVITPSDYTARSVGYGWESEGVNDSLRLRNKIMLVENDARTWMGKESETLGAFLTPEKVRFRSPVFW